MLTFYQKYYVHLNLSLVVLLGLACGLLAGAWLDTNINWEVGASDLFHSSAAGKDKGYYCR